VTPSARCTSGSTTLPRPSGPCSISTISSTRCGVRSNSPTPPGSSRRWARTSPRFRGRTARTARRGGPGGGALPPRPRPMSGRRARRRLPPRAARLIHRSLPLPCPLSASSFSPGGTSMSLSPPRWSGPEDRTPPKDEEERLRELGYQPVLARRMGSFGNFAISARGPPRGSPGLVRRLQTGNGNEVWAAARSSRRAEPSRAERRGRRGRRGSRRAEGAQPSGPGRARRTRGDQRAEPYVRLRSSGVAPVREACRPDPRAAPPVGPARRSGRPP
jgi:hypothetical protein